nr:cardiolipin synthase [Mesobacillus harenae]
MIGFILLLFVWLMADFSLGRKKHLSQARFETYPVRSGSLVLFTKGEKLFTDMFNELKKAEHHIHVLFYIAKNDQISCDFLAILKDKAKAGIEVRLLLDRIGSKSVSRQMIKDLKQSGVKFSFCNVPRFPYIFYSTQVRNHRKITIIDGKVGYLGGYNLGKEYIDKDPELSPWRDYHLKLIGESVQDLQQEFLLDWNRTVKTGLLKERVYFPQLPKGPLQQQIVASEGVHLEQVLSSLIKKADQSITIGTPYFVPSKRLQEDMLHALKRGIRLTILFPHQADHILVKEASYYFLRPLLKEGARVYEYMKGFYHAKVILIDDKVCDLGTANFDKRSIFLNHELNCIIFDETFSQKMAAVLHKDILDSEELTLMKLSGFNPFRTLKEKAALSISYFL